jgi:hypothetical protein
MAEQAQNQDPMVLSAFKTDEFMASARAAVSALHLDGTALERIRDPFVVVIDEEGIFLCPEDPEGRPYANVKWPMIGRLHDDSVQHPNTAESVVAILTVGLIAQSRVGKPVLCVPILAKAGTVELRLALDVEVGVAKEAEKRRPRVSYGPMLDWVPE